MPHRYLNPNLENQLNRVHTLVVNYRGNTRIAWSENNDMFRILGELLEAHFFTLQYADQQHIAQVVERIKVEYNYQGFDYSTLGADAYSYYLNRGFFKNY